MDAYGHGKGVRLETEVTAMEERKESEKERFERQRKQTMEAIADHRRLMETDPEYKAESERFFQSLITFGNDNTD